MPSTAPILPHLVVSLLFGLHLPEVFVLKFVQGGKITLGVVPPLLQEQLVSVVVTVFQQNLSCDYLTDLSDVVAILFC